MYKQGDQIAYVPTHANGNLRHPDVQFGFVMRHAENMDAYFCRYWRSDLRSLRTVANSELTPSFLLVRVDTVEQSRIEAVIRDIEQEAHHG